MTIHNSINLPYPIPANLGGTGVANSLSNTITLGGPISFVGAYPFIGNLTASTNITFPVSGTLLTTAGITLNGTTNQIAVSGTSPSFTLSFPSVLHTANGNVLDDGSANASFLGTTFVFGSNTPGSPATMYLTGSSANAADEGHLWFYKSGTTPTGNGDSLGEIAIYGVNSGGTSQRAARIMSVSAALATSNSVQTELDFRFTDSSGAEKIPFTLNYQGFTLNGCPTTFTGSSTVNFNFTGPTNVTFPTSGVLATVGGTVSSVVGTTNRITVNTVSGVSTVDIAATYVGQSSITTLGTITTGTWHGSLIPMAFGGTNANLTATVNNLVYSTSTAMALLPTANNGTLITSNTGVPSISSTLPTAVQTNITQVGTITSGVWNGTIVDSGHGGTGLGLPSPGYMLVGGASAGSWTFLTAPSGSQILGTDVLGGIFWLSTLPTFVQTNITALGTIGTGTWNGSVVGSQWGGTGVNNGSNTITFAGNLNFANSFTTSGNFAVTQTYTGITSVTFPTSGTLLSNANGPLNALSSYNTNGLVTQTAANTFTGRTLTGTAGTITVTNGNGVSGNPTITIDSAYVGQTSITTLGTVTSGTWNAGVIPGQYGGTGVANTGKTITIGGNVTFSGAFAFTGTLTNTTSVTFPTSGTLVNTAVTTLSSLVITESQVSNLPTDLAAKLNLSGGTMTGNLILNANATNALQAVTLQQMQTAVNSANFVAATFCGGF